MLVALEDPDPLVGEPRIQTLRDAGIQVDGEGAAEVTAQLAPYLKHRRTGRPYVVLKMAASVDGRTAAPDRSSQWITGPDARADAHRMRAEAMPSSWAQHGPHDDHALAVRDAEGDDSGRARPCAGGCRAQPALEMSGALDDVLAQLGEQGVVQAMVEGATVAGEFHRAGLVDRYVVYFAPALFGGDDGRPVFSGPGAATMEDVARPHRLRVDRLGDDLRVELEPA